MRKSDKINTTIFLILWTSLIVILFLHISGKVDFKFLHFSQATGNLVMVEEGYKGYNLLGLRENMYAVPQGAPFVHPKRTKKMKKWGIFHAYSLQESRRMVDAGTEDIEPKLVPIEQHFLGFNIYSLNGKIYAVPDQGEPAQYVEREMGTTLEEAKEKITQYWKSRQ
ncbi:MAG: hypothetical protein A3F16_00465 [Deltaproteobacteria bacterium RIFCSPHIGHO2_12_FULL_43_9]|nr:MAG: hypothetical protein A3F16_00465 [Deltaproteobacteria bacterium RIFCSPHIGHO2_12_FULL_43_9]